MSTKIYNGYKIKGQMTFGELNLFCQKLGEKVSKKRKELAVKLFAKLYMEDILLIFSGGYPEFHGKLQDCIALNLFERAKYKQDEIKKTQRRNPEFDFDFEVVFIQCRKSILCLLYAEQAEFVKLWKSLPKVEPYGYWNNTDRPEGISSREWNERKTEWEEAIPGATPPSKRGLIYSPNDNGSHLFFLGDEFRNGLLRKDAVESLSRTLLRKWWLVKHKGLHNPRNQEISYHMRFLRDFKKFISVAESKKIRKRCELKARWRLRQWDKIVRQQTYSGLFKMFNQS